MEMSPDTLYPRTSFYFFAAFCGPIICEASSATSGTVRIMPMEPASPRISSIAMASVLKI